MLILLCHRNDKAQICCYQLIFSTFTFESALANFLCQFNFLVNTNQRGTSNFNKILIKCFTRTVGDTLLNF